MWVRVRLALNCSVVAGSDPTVAGVVDGTDAALSNED